MNDWRQRTTALIGADGTQRLAASSVLVVGVGGVGGAVAEMLARAGVGRVGLVDCDTVEETNLNRQIVATVDTIGRPKVSAMRDRLVAVAPRIAVDPYLVRVDQTNVAQLLAHNWDWVADCIDDVDAKVALILTASQYSIPIVSAMGAGRRITADFALVDVMRTSNDALARAVRTRLRQCGYVGGCVAVCPTQPALDTGDQKGSLSYVVMAMACRLVQHIITSVIK